MQRESKKAEKYASACSLKGPVCEDWRGLTGTICLNIHNYVFMAVKSPKNNIDCVLQ